MTSNQSILCFAAAWWEDEHLGVLVAVTDERHLLTGWFLFKRSTPYHSFRKARSRQTAWRHPLEAMFTAIIEAANRALEGSGLSGQAWAYDPCPTRALLVCARSGPYGRALAATPASC